VVLHDSINGSPFACEHTSTLSMVCAMPSVRFVHYKYLFHSSFDYRGIGSVPATYPQGDLLANL